MEVKINREIRNYTESMFFGLSLRQFVFFLYWLSALRCFCTADHIKLGEKYARVLFLKDYASYIKDSMFSELTEPNRNLMLSVDVIPIPTDEAVREVERLLLGVETNITGWQRRQNQNNNFSAVVPYDMELQRKESKEFLDDLTTRDQRMMFAVVTMVITADSKEQLDLDTETVLSTARKHMCQMATLKYQQTDGLNTVLPIGTRKINAFRTLTTESLAVLMPFKVQEIIIIPAMIEIDDVVSDSFRINLLTYRFRPQLAHLQRFQDNCLALAGFQNLHPPFLPEHMRRHYLSPRQEGRPART